MRVKRIDEKKIFLVLEISWLNYLVKAFRFGKVDLFVND